MSGEEAGPSAAGGRDGKGPMGGREEENIGREGKTGASDPVYMANGRPILTGWPLIEEWMTTLDKGMVSDFNDDINTLLTFAGLFSAVLAGFLVQLYVGLQPSNNQDTNNLLAQNTLELRQISRQLANSSFVPVDIPLPSPSFQAGASIVWINTLWFLSLILSLASALFGMISKQWLREYLQWTTMSGLSETQVGLRQGRYEAFKDWKTPAIIASMPVLLEIALILFLLGMEVLLWTLNTVVFGVCTVAVIAIIVLVITVTVLPLFRPRCAYKSPMGWAAVSARRGLFSLYNRCVDFYKVFRDWLGPNDFRTLQHRLEVRGDKDWRAWDVSRQMWGRGITSVSLFMRQAAMGRYRMQSRALLWIAETSQDQRLLRAVEESIVGRTLPQDWNNFDRLVVDFYVACDYLGIDLSQLVPPEDKCASIGELDGGRVIDVSYFTSRLHFRMRLANNDQWHDRMLDVDASPSVCVWIAQMLAYDVQAVVSQHSERNIDSFVSHFGLLDCQANYILQMSLALCGRLAYRVLYHDRRLASVIDSLATLFRYFCCNYDKLPLRLRPLLPLLAASLDEYERRLMLTLSLIKNLQCTRLALTVPAGQPSTWSQSDCSLFSCLAQLALREWRTEHRSSDTEVLLLPLLDRMAACVLRCLDRHWKDCAMGEWQLDWARCLRELFDPGPSLGNSSSSQHLSPDLFPHDLVDALKQYCDADLVTDFIESQIHIVSLVSRSASLHDQHAVSGETADHIRRPESPHQGTSSEQACPQRVSLSLSSVRPPVSPSQADDQSACSPVSYDDPVVQVHPSPSPHMDIVGAPPRLSTQDDSTTARHPLDQSIPFTVKQTGEMSALTSTGALSELVYGPPVAASLENEVRMIEMQEIRWMSQAEELEGATNEAATRPSHSSNVSQTLQVHDAAGMVPATTAQISTHIVDSTPYHTDFDNPASTKNEAPADSDASQDDVVRTMNNQRERLPPDISPLGSLQE